MQVISHHSYSSRRSAILARNVVATSQPLAAQAGLGMLARGGNAVDAAIATAATLCVVEPTGNGLGADAFAILWDGTQLHGLNASGRAPAGWGPDRFAGLQKMPFWGWEAVTVPGAVSGWVALWEKFGSLPFETLLEPAISYAENGFAVSPVIADLWARGAAQLANQPGFADVFMPNGAAPKAGQWFTNPALGHSLRRIAQTTGAAFYTGDLAEKIVDFAKMHGAALSMQDLADHRADWCGTISQQFDDVSLHEIPPNGQGIAALMGLGILNHTGIRDLHPDDPQALHLQIEAMKLALRDAETYVADPAHMGHVSSEDLLDPSYLKARAQLISPRQATNFGAGAPKRGGTVYLSAVSYTHLTLPTNREV